MANLFVSYSRRDSAAARKLIEAFKSIGQEVWVDWEDIPPAADWLEQIFRGIEEADAFVFMISPDSIASEVCKVEVGRAILNNKRIIPIVLRDVDPKNTLDDIRKLNWTFIRESDNFEEGLAKVKTAIELDLDWLEEHRRLQVRALEWHRKKDTSLLLHGRDLRNAQHMMQTYTSKDPIPTELQRKYIEHSRRRETTRYIMWAVTAVVLVTLGVLTYLAVTASIQARASEAEALAQREEAIRQQGIAEENAALAIKNQREADANARSALAEKEIADKQRLIAQAQRSAARAQIYQSRTGELYTSTLLAIDSWKKSPSEEAEEILRENISLLPIPVAQAYQTGSSNVLELRPDDETFISVSADGILCLRRTSDAQELDCPTYLPPVEDAIFIQDGEAIAAVDAEGMVRVVNPVTGEITTEIDAAAPVRDMDVTPNGRTLAIGRADGRIIIIDVDEPISRADILFLSGGNLSVIAFSPDGRWIAAGSESGVVAAWRLGSTHSLSLPPHRAGVLSLAFSPNSRFLITGGADNYANGYDILNEQDVFRLLHSDWVTDIEFPAGDSSWFVTASEDARVRIWELTTAQERLIMFQDGPVRDVTISSDGKWIAATGEDETVRVWSASSGVEMYQVPLKANGISLIFSQDDQLLVSSDEAGKLAIWDVSGMKAPAATTEFTRLAWTSQFTPDGDRLIASVSNRIRIIDSQDSSTPLARIPLDASYQFPGDILSLIVSPDSQTAGISTASGETFLYDLQTRSPLQIESVGAISAFTFSLDGAHFITASSQGNLVTWDVGSGEEVQAIEVGEPIVSLAASPAGIAVGLADRVLIFDPESGQTIDELSSPGGNQFMAFNRDGSMIACASSTGLIQLWQADNGGYEPLEPIQKGPTYALALNQEGSMLAVAAANDVYLIDTATGQEAGRIAHRGIVNDVSFSPDGTALATASQKMVQLWDVSTLQPLEEEELIEAACSRLIENFTESEWAALFGRDQPYEKLCENLP